MPDRNAFLFLTHKLFPRLSQQISAARTDLAGVADVHVIGYFEDPSTAPAPFGVDQVYHAYGPERLAQLGYLRKAPPPLELVPGNTDLLTLAFAREHPEYDTVWLFEYDVVFTGSISELVSAFARSDSDLLTTNVRTPSRYWRHHSMTYDPAGELGSERLQGFLPVFRASRRLIEAVDRFYADGGNGHNELLWPTLARARGLGVEDIGGSGPYVRPGNRNRFYTSSPAGRAMYPGTFRWRPSLRPGRRRSTLWHPVMEDHETFSLAHLAEHLRHLAHWRWALIDREKLKGP